MKQYADQSAYVVLKDHKSKFYDRFVMSNY